MPKRGTKLTLSQQQRFEIFIRRADELRELPLVRDLLAGKRWTATISGSSDNPDWTIQLPDVNEDQLRSFLLLFRQFISNDEPIFINAIFNQIYLALKNPTHKENLLRIRERWKDIFQEGPIRLTVNNDTITPEYVLNLWINGIYFHNDLDKAAEFERLTANSLQLGKMHCLQSLPPLTEIILRLGSVLRYGLANEYFDLSDEHNSSSANTGKPIT